MKSGNINFIDTELTNEQFASLGYPALYILKNSSNTVTKFIIFDLNGVRTDYDTSSGGVALSECGEHRSLSGARLRLQDDGRRCGTRNGHRPMVGIPDGMRALSALLSPVGQV
jgi:hypothetical protein